MLSRFTKFFIGIFLLTAGVAHAETIFEDHFDRQNSSILGGVWTEMNELYSSVVGPSGQTHYPAFIELLDGAMNFRYPAPDVHCCHHSNIYTYAPMKRDVNNAIMSFTFSPTVTGRVEHVVGMMDKNKGFIYPSGLSPQEYLRYDPVKGLGVIILNSGDVQNSSIMLLKYDGTVSRLTPDNIHLPFQFVGGGVYQFTLSVNGDLCTVTISNALQTFTTSVPLNGFVFTKNQVFVEDEQSGDDGLRFDDFVVTTNDARKVSIDIKPGSTLNPINLRSMGGIPVAILSDDSFDATQVDPASIILSGAHVQRVGSGHKFTCDVRDVNADERQDLICRMSTQELDLSEESTTALLEAKTLKGMRIWGEDNVRVVP